jgi:pimeloyl-ACP methyl ester carboxylesterase
MTPTPPAADRPRKRAHPARAFAALWALAPITLAPGALALAPAPPQPPDEKSTHPAPTEAETFLTEAQTAAQTGLHWLRLRGQHAQDAAKGAAANAGAAWKSTVASAAAVQLHFGVSIYTPRPRDPTATTPAATSEPATWQPLEQLPPAEALPSHLVLLIHGLDEPGSIWTEVTPALRNSGFNVARFDYPDDQHIARSAALLGTALEDLHSRGVQNVDLVCHSMGGLLARDVLTSTECYAGDCAGSARLPAVGRVFLIGTPNKGSPLAGLQVVAEIREHIMRWVDTQGHDPAAPLGFLNDGDGEAGEDLHPGSDYLRELNARPMPRNVRFTVIVGQLVQENAARLPTLAEQPLAREILGDKAIAALAAGTKNAAQRLGDGVVPRESALLEGVTDTVFVVANHRSLLNRWGLQRRLGSDTAQRQLDNPAPAIPVILERLNADAHP